MKRLNRRSIVRSIGVSGRLGMGNGNSILGIGRRVRGGPVDLQTPNGEIWVAV
jgi:hypothetical protein